MNNDASRKSNCKVQKAKVKLTEEELQEAVNHFLEHRVYIAPNDVHFVILKPQRKGEKQVTIWQLVKALRAALSQAQAKNDILKRRVEELENMLVRWHNTAGDRLMPGEYEDWLDVDYVRQWGQAYYRYMKAQEQLENEAERLSGARAAEREEAEGG